MIEMHHLKNTVIFILAILSFVLSRKFINIYRNNSLCFDQLLQIDKSYNIHHKNIQTLAIELYKVKNNLSNQIMQEVFEKHESVDYNLRFQTDFVLPSVNTTYFGLHSLRYFFVKILMVFLMRLKTP